MGGAGLDFDSDGNLYLGVGDDVSPNAPGHNGYAPMDYRSAERWDARKTSQNSADLRGKILRIKPNMGAIAADADARAEHDVHRPGGQSVPGRAGKTRPEIFAMGFRQPFTLHTDPAKPGTVVTGEYCHDNGSDAAQRSPAGTCEWNLLNKPGNHGWPFCVGDNSPALYDVQVELRRERDDGPAVRLQRQPDHDRHPLRARPARRRWSRPTTAWTRCPARSRRRRSSKSTRHRRSRPAFGDLTAGGMQPITGPIYRYATPRRARARSRPTTTVRG